MLFRNRLFASALLLTFASPLIAGEWRFKKSVDPITDEETSVLLALGEQREALASITCMQGSPRVGVLMPVPFQPDRNSLVKVTTRVDKNDPVVRSWRADTSTGFIGSPESESALVYDMKRGSRLVVRTEDDNGREETYFFALSGVTAGMKKLDCDPAERISGQEGRSLTKQERIGEVAEKKLKGLFD